MDFTQTKDEVVQTCNEHNEILGKRTIRLPPGDNIRHPAKYTTSFDSNLVSLKVLSECMDIEYTTASGFVTKERSSGKIVHTIKPRDGLYLSPNPTKPERAQSALRQPENIAKEWHEKLGHTGM